MSVFEVQDFAFFLNDLDSILNNAITFDLTIPTYSDEDQRAHKSKSVGRDPTGWFFTKADPDST